MSNKDLLIELCERLQDSLSENEGRIVPVKLISELRPYYGINDGADEWVVEIKVQGEVVFKEWYVPKKTEDFEIVEGMLITRILRNIFFHGVTSARNSNSPFIQS